MTHTSGTVLTTFNYNFAETVCVEDGRWTGGGGSASCRRWEELETDRLGKIVLDIRQARPLAREEEEVFEVGFVQSTSRDTGIRFAAYDHEEQYDVQKIYYRNQLVGLRFIDLR